MKQKSESEKKKIVYLLFLIILIAIFLMGFYLIENKSNNQEILTGNEEQIEDFNEYSVSPQNPEEVVRTYFGAWNHKDYPVMYNQLSDGFKKIDPIAKDLESFSNYINSYFDSASEVILKSFKETINDGTTATVDYAIIMKLNSGDKEFSSTYTLKKRENGWKLIHPYGENIDTS